MTKSKDLTIMDNASGGKVYSVNLANVTRSASNTQDEYIYIADNDGRVACLKPAVEVK